MPAIITDMQTPGTTRPYWHVDAKWIAGILLFLSLSSGLLFYNLSVITEREHAVNITTTIVAGLFSQNGLSDERSLADFRKQAARTKGSILHPIPQFPSVTISKHDALTLSATALRLAIFSQITGPIYDLGVDGAAKKFTPNPRQQQQFAQQASTLGLITKLTHDLFQRMFVATAVVSLILLLLVVYFSAGWGRLVSPGVILLAVSPAGSLTALFLLFPAPGKGSLQTSIPANLATDLGASLVHSYLYALFGGLLLLVAAFIGKVVSILIQQNRNPFAKSKP